jgi:hypothetical protein
VLELDSIFEGAAPGVMLGVAAALGVAAVGAAAAGVAGVAEAGCAVAAFPAAGAGEAALDSSSATRFLSSTNWSSKYLSRSVIGAGASTVDGAGFAGGLLALLSVFVSGLVSGFVSAFVSGLPSSAKEHGTATIPVNVRNKTQERIHPFTSAAISLSCCLTDNETLP